MVPQTCSMNESISLSCEYATGNDRISVSMAFHQATTSALEPEKPALASRLSAGVELSALIILVEAISWLVPILRDSRVAYASLSVMIIALLLLCYLRDDVSIRDLGLRVDNLPRVLSRIWLPLAVFVVLVVAVGLARGTINFGAKFFSMLIAVPLWALLQQYMLLAFANRRLRTIMGAGTHSVLATAALFSLLHLPNPVLTVACAFGGYIWAREYEREPNLFANAITHAIASAFLANSLSHSLLKNMVVGYNYFFR